MRSSTNAGLLNSVALYSATQIAMIEQRYAEHSKSGTYPLMEKAGASAFRQLLSQWPKAKKIIVVVGKGNNAGDGFVLARLAAERRFKVDLCHLAEPSQLSGDGLKAYLKISRQVVHKVAIEQVRFSEYDVIVDAMLGTGIKGKLNAPYPRAIKAINSNSVPVLAVDIPTGIEADTGFVYGEAVKADLTVTFVGHKKGMYTGDAANYRGKVKLFSLDIPECYYDHHTFHLFSQSWHSSKHLLKPREKACHKGVFGHTIVIGGHSGMSGAAILASTAAARSGSGLTSAWVSPECATCIVNRTPEVMAKGITQSEIAEQFNLLAKSGYVFVVGPGLGRAEWSDAWMNALSQQSSHRDSFQVWDADALNWLASLPKEHHNKYNSRRILTPHPMEAARLLGMSTFTVNQDRFNVAQQIATEYGGLCVLKGNGTIIADEKGFQVVCPVGNPGMASGGMGDVLAGIIGGLLAQGYGLMDASILGVCIHGEAADRVAGRSGQFRGMLASDLFEYFPVLLNP